MGNKKLAIISIVIFVMALLIFMATLYMTFFRSDAGQTAKPKKTYTCDLGDFSTNIGTSGRYFKGNIVVETTGKKTPEIILKNVEPIRDYVLKLIISQNIKEMTNEKGMTELSEKIKNEIARITQTEDITNVYFTEYIIQ